MKASATAGFVLDEQLCFALHSASRAVTGCYRPLLERIGLTYTQYAVMLVLWETTTIGLSELCQRLQMDTATLSPLLKRLETQGLLSRVRRPEDERTVQLTVTTAGKRLRDRAAAAQVQVVRNTGLNPDEIADLRDQLTALSARLRAVD